jgi:flagellar biogenesis protein FliO
MEAIIQEVGTNIPYKQDELVANNTIFVSFGLLVLVVFSFFILLKFNKRILNGKKDVEECKGVSIDKKILTESSKLLIIEIEGKQFYLVESDKNITSLLEASQTSRKITLMDKKSEDKYA